MATAATPIQNVQALPGQTDGHDPLVAPETFLKTNFNLLCAEVFFWNKTGHCIVNGTLHKLRDLMRPIVGDAKALRYAKAMTEAEAVARVVDKAPLF